MFTTSLEGGFINHTDSPLLRAIKYGRVIIIDEADKAPEHVVAIFRSLAGQGELTLSDGRRVRPTQGRRGDIVVHPDFRLILLANRPGYRMLSFKMDIEAELIIYFGLQHSSGTTSYRFSVRTLVLIPLATPTQNRRKIS